MNKNLLIVGATVAGSTLVPPGTKVESSTIFDRKIIGSNI